MLFAILFAIAFLNSIESKPVGVGDVANAAGGAVNGAANAVKGAAKGASSDMKGPAQRARNVDVGAIYNVGGGGGSPRKGDVNNGITTHIHRVNLQDKTKTGVSNERCRNGLIDGTAHGIRNAIDSFTTGLEDGISSAVDSGKFLGLIGAAIDTVARGGNTLIKNFFDGLDDMVSDAACGLGDMGDTAADALDTGDILTGIGEMGREFVFGTGSIFQDATSHIVSGIADAVNDLANFFENVI